MNIDLLGQGLISFEALPHGRAKAPRLAEDCPFDPDDAISDFEEAEKELMRKERQRVQEEADSDSTTSNEETGEEELSDGCEDKSVFSPAWSAWPEFHSSVSSVSEEIKAKVISLAPSLKFPDRLLKNIDKLGWTAPLLVQQIVIPIATVTRKNVCIASETGSGKTGAFSIPCIFHMLERKRNSKTKASLDTLVLAPSHELATQVGTCFKDLCAGLPIKVCVVVGGISIHKQIRLLNQKPDVVIGTVGRFKALLLGDGDSIEPHEYLSSISKTLKHVIIDEADRMLETGKLRDMEKIFEKINETSSDKQANCQYLIASATLTLTSDNFLHFLPVQKNCWQMVDLTSESYKEDFKRAKQLKLSAKTEFLLAAGTYKTKYADLCLQIKAYTDKPGPFKIIVFANTIDFAQKLHRFISLLFTIAAEARRDAPLKREKQAKRKGAMTYLPLKVLAATDSKQTSTEREPAADKRKQVGKSDVQVLSLTSRQKQQQRYKVFETFKSEDCRAILVATDIAARGLDFPNVDMVIHAQCPRSVELLVHRSGRTARGTSEKGKVVFLVQKEEMEHYTFLVKEKLGTDAPVIHDIVTDEYKKERAAVKRICDIADEIETAQFRLARRNKERDWRRRNAAEAELVDSDLEIELENAPAEDSEVKRQISVLQSELRRLLAK